MRTTVCALTVFALAASAWAIDKTELDMRIRKLGVRFEQMQQNSEKRIPPETLAKAHGIVLMDRTKAGFIFAYQGGSGVALVKDPKSQKWGPAAFLKASEASLGFLAGGQQTFMVILFMSPEAAKLLTESTVDFGGEARGTAGDASAGAEGTVSNQERPVLVYDDRRGLYGGAAIKGGTVSPDEKANMIYYGQALMTKEILFDKKVKPTEAAVELAGKIDQLSKNPKK